MPHSILRNDVAGCDVTRYLKLLLRKEGHTFKTTAEFEIVKSIKERACFLTSTALKDEINTNDKSQFTLPDGSSIDVCMTIRSIHIYSMYLCQWTRSFFFLDLRSARVVVERPKSCSIQNSLAKSAKVSTRYCQALFNVLIWTFDVHSIKISFFLVVQRYFVVCQTIDNKRILFVIVVHRFR
jgi:hypothetical protein